MILEKKSLLVVDDDKHVRSIMEVIAKRCGAVVTMAQNGEEALQILHNGNSFDAIFLDLMMPGVSGWEVLHSIRQSSETESTPVCLFSGATISRTEKQALCSDLTHFLNKGEFSFSHLTSFVKLMLSTRSTSSQSSLQVASNLKAV